jgi:hypothetical protein
MEKYPWAAGRTIAVGVSDEHPFIAAAYKSARKHHLLFRQRQFQIAYLERLEQMRRSILKRGIEMNDRHAISLRISAAVSAHSLIGDKSKKRLSNGGVRRWIEGIDDNPIWEEDENAERVEMYNPVVSQSVTALRI